jgi:nitroimidazol reductase NimA-like FMN-containing flavoprotein (pyridoxamine 5'-phosphate oxidase superfamily)
MSATNPAETPSLPRGARHEVRRTRNRAHYDEATVHAILDAGMVAHVGFGSGAQPFVIPMLYARDGSTLLLHGSVASRLCGDLAAGVPVCACVTHLDGLVLARSHFDHSVNYRSVVVFGRARLLADVREKVAALARLVETLVPGRTAEARPPDASELAATHVLRLDIEDASAKIRSGGPREAAGDLALPFWAGVLPLETRFGAPQPAGDLVEGVGLPPSARALLARGATASP